MNNSRWLIFAVLAVFLLALVLVVPEFVPTSQDDTFAAYAFALAAMSLAISVVRRLRWIFDNSTVKLDGIELFAVTATFYVGLVATTAIDTEPTDEKVLLWIGSIVSMLTLAAAILRKLGAPGFRKRQHITWIGAVLTTVGLVVLLLVTTISLTRSANGEGTSWEWAGPLIELFFTSAAVAAVVLVAVGLVSRRPGDEQAG